MIEKVLRESYVWLRRPSSARSCPIPTDKLADYFSRMYSSDNTIPKSIPIFNWVRSEGDLLEHDAPWSISEVIDTIGK